MDLLGNIILNDWDIWCRTLINTIPTQLIMVTFMGPYSLGLALSIRLGATIPVLVSRAKQTVADTFIFSAIAFGTISIIMYMKQNWLISLFTTAEAVVIGCHEIWWKVCIYSFCLSIYAIFMGVCIGLGMQWTLGIGTIIALWVIGLPSGYYFAVVKDGGIDMAWSTVWPPYILLPIALTIAIVRADWDKVALEIRKREGLELSEDRRPSFFTLSNRDLTESNLPEQQPLLSPLKLDEQTYGSSLHHFK
jgi:Na+-driven multidrug efflux pump